jgi:hypothetical protein
MGAFWRYFLDFFGLRRERATVRAILTADSGRSISQLVN